jgi:large subunit ribosomal protein L13
MNKEHIIDAAGQSLGRVASEAAKVLLGKDSTAFAKNVVRDVKVKVINVSKLNTTEKKMKQKTYHFYTGYVGNQKSPTLSQLAAKKGMGEAVRISVKGMLPGNTLRDKRMKNLITVD